MTAISRKSSHGPRGELARDSALTALGALAAAAPAVALAGAHDGLVVLATLFGVGLGAITLARLVVARRGAVGPLARQFGVAIAITVGQMLIVVVAATLLMFVSAEQALVFAAVVAFAGFVAAVALRLLMAGVLADINAIRDGLHAVGAGDRDVRIATRGRDELAQLADAANAMVARLSTEESARAEADAARRRLVAAVSHDLRTPLASLRLLAEAIDDDVVDGPLTREYARRITTHVQSLSVLIDDLFELTRLQAGDIGWAMEQVSVDELVAETVTAMRVQAEAKGVAMHATVDPGLGPAHANPEKLQRVLVNLVQNAIRHTPADGSVTVRATAAPGAVEVEVADTGPGIEHAERDRVFEPFYRGGADASRTSEGAGLGLAIARAIVEAHGGRIWLAQADRGTRVRFELPSALEPR